MVAHYSPKTENTYNVSCIFPEIFHGQFANDEALFEALAAAIEAAHKGKVVEVLEWKEGVEYDFHKCGIVRKLNLLATGCRLTFTLTKKGNSCNIGPDSQFRVWVGSFGFHPNGRHVDGYDHGAIFGANGDREVLTALIEKFLTGKYYRRFEDDCFVVWV